MAEMVCAALVQETVSRGVSFALGKREEKPCQGHLVERLEMAVSQLEFAVERGQELRIRHLSLIGQGKLIMSAYVEATELLDKLKQQAVPAGQEPEDAHRVKKRKPWVISAGLSTSSFASLTLSTVDVERFERYADFAEKFVRHVVESASCLLRRPDTSSYPFLRHLFKGKTLRCERLKNPSQSLSFMLHPVILEGRGVQVILCYEYKDLKKREECLCLTMSLRISEETDIIGISMKCMQWFTSQFKLVAESAQGELKIMPDSQDIFRDNNPPAWLVKDAYVHDTERFRPDPVCCSRNSYKSSLEVPDPVIEMYFSCNISAPENNLRTAPLSLHGAFWPHDPGCSHERITAIYGHKQEDKNCSVQLLPEIAGSEGVDYLVHEREPTDYVLYWYGPHGCASVAILPALMEEPEPEPSRRRVSKRKR